MLLTAADTPAVSRSQRPRLTAFARCRVVLVGDPKQLPATVKSLVAQKLSLARSLFERLQVRVDVRVEGLAGVMINAMHACMM